ncbi:GNAT family N-acetyltransferase [Mumia sp. DW29H23]|uniref:GNAT family N-acetyltransferase n=1 Tax=Mumia sp. DW29H23 TaxID=3421241 RepID=UPI003D698F36
MPDVTPELAEPEDARAVRALVRTAYAPYVPRVGREPAPMNEDYVKAIEDGDVHVVRDAGAVVAVLVTRGRDDHLLIENIAVEPGRQGSGLGGQVLGWAEARAASLGYGEVRLYTHVTMVENIAFYGRHGYEVTRVAEEDEFRRVHFRKVLHRPGESP